MQQIETIRWVLGAALAIEVTVLVYVLGWLAIHFWHEWRDWLWIRRVWRRYY